MNKIKLSDHFTYKKLFRFVFPTIIMMVFTSIYGVVDGYFVSNYVGKTPFAALNLVMPFIMILGGMGFMIGTGGSALVAKELGLGNKDKANSYFSLFVCFTIILGIILSAIGVIFIRPVSIFLGATESMIESAVLYGRITTAFTISFMLQNVFQSFLATAEKPRMGLRVTVAAGLTNAVLDALFIIVFKWGLAGAALATGIGQCVGGIIPLVYFMRKNNSLLRLVKPSFELKPIVKACTNGSSELMSNISSSIVGMLYNWQLIRLIGENGVSAYGVLMYVQFIFIAIPIGYSIGTAPLVSFNYGAGNHTEMKNLLKKSIILNSITGITLTVLAISLSAPLAHIFVGYDKELYDLSVSAFKLFSLSFILDGFNIYASGFFTALNNGLVSAVISFMRTLVFQTSSIIVLPIILGSNGIWLANTVAQVFAFIISLTFLIILRKRYKYF